MLITTIAGIWKAKHGIRTDKHGNEHFADNRENSTTFSWGKIWHRLLMSMFKLVMNS